MIVFVITMIVTNFGLVYMLNSKQAETHILMISLKVFMKLNGSNIIWTFDIGIKCYNKKMDTFQDTRLYKSREVLLQYCNQYEHLIDNGV
jgi:hypothetical protein